MDLAQARRFARHVALPEIGPDGQTRILAATVLVVNDEAAGLALETAALYLGFAGIGRFVVVSADHDGDEPAWVQTVKAALPEPSFEVLPMPASGIAWAAALLGVQVVLRADFRDDAMVPACRARGVPAVVVRSPHDAEPLDLLSLRPGPPQGHADPPSIPPSPPSPALDLLPLAASGQVVAGTLAATEALWLIVDRPAQPENADATASNIMRHLRLPLASPGVRPTTHNIAWTSIT